MVGFQYREDAERCLREFQERLGKFGLELHPEKTRLLEFGRFAAQDRHARGESKPETFTFLGFTHMCGQSPRGLFVVWRETANKRLRAKLKQIKQTLRSRMHQPLAQIGAWLRSVCLGFYRYHAVPGNTRALSVFRHRICQMWRRTLRHRGDRPHTSWERVHPLFDRWLLSRAHSIPILLTVSTLLIHGKSRMREFRTYGSVRGVLGNWHPYRDRWLGWQRVGRERWGRDPLAVLLGWEKNHPLLTRGVLLSLVFGRLG